MTLQVFSEENWLPSPIKSDLGALSFAGIRRDNFALNPQKMRVLGSYGFILVMDGTGFYQDATGRHEELSAGSTLTLFPHLAHAYGPVGGSTWEQIYVVFDGPQFALLQKQGLLEPTQPLALRRRPSYWADRLRDFFQEAEATAGDASLLAVSRFTPLLLEMTRPQDPTKPTPSAALWAKAQQLLTAGTSETWPTPQAVARELGLGYENFRKQFRAEVGMPPRQFQQQRRIDLACTALYQGSASIKELATQLGFVDPYHFSKVFRQYMGEAPSAYRKRMRGR